MGAWEKLEARKAATEGSVERPDRAAIIAARIRNRIAALKDGNADDALKTAMRLAEEVRSRKP
jgi:hypothetical protein